MIHATVTEKVVGVFTAFSCAASLVVDFELGSLQKQSEISTHSRLRYSSKRHRFLLSSNRESPRTAWRQAATRTFTGLVDFFNQAVANSRDETFYTRGSGILKRHGFLLSFSNRDESPHGLAHAEPSKFAGG
jgi:hypothetical protein